MITNKSDSGRVIPAKKRIMASTMAVALALMLTVVVGQSASQPAYAASDRLPDLGMAKFRVFKSKGPTVGSSCISAPS